jgi:mannose-6-phosphate isomerase-like protein (cupin superfamily)
MQTLHGLTALAERTLPLRPLNRRSLLQWLVAAAAAANLGSGLEAAEPLPPDQPPRVPPIKPPRRAVYISPKDRRHGKFAQIAFKMASEDTDGLLGSAELVLEPGTIGAVPHLHRGFDEISRVLEGTVHIMVDNQVTAVPAGGWHLRPRGLIHAFWNSGPTQARCVELYIPGGHERFMNELADLFESGPPTRAAVSALATHNDIEFHFELLEDLMARYKVHL